MEIHPESHPRSVKNRTFLQQVAWLWVVWLISLGLILGTIFGPFFIGFQRGIKNVRKYWDIENY